MKAIGSILLAVGFLAGAFVAVVQVEAVNWLHYGGCAGLMLVGLLTTRAARSAQADESERHDADLDVLDESLGKLAEKVAELASIQDDRDLLGVHTRIDDELMDDLNAFVDARESMIPRLGMQRYADVMSPFATGERLLNRAWSASADGYVDEVRLCVHSAQRELEEARRILREGRAG